MDSGATSSHFAEAEIAPSGKFGAVRRSVPILPGMDINWLLFEFARATLDRCRFRCGVCHDETKLVTCFLCGGLDMIG